MADLKFKTKDEIPEDLRNEAKEVDGQFVVSVVSKAKVTEFRDNNIALKTELEQKNAKLAAYESAVGPDPEKISGELTALREVDQRVKDGKLSTTDKIDSEVARRLTESKGQYEAQIKALSEKNAALERSNTETTSKYNRSVVERYVTDAALAKDSGVNPQALPHILAQANSVFHVTPEGKLIAKQNDVMIYGADGVSSITPKEWLGKVLQDAPFFKLDSTGGGATNGDKGGLNGLSQDQLDKLSPTERMAAARKAKAA